MPAKQHKPYRQRTELEKTLTRMKESGRLDAVDVAARIAVCRGLADVIDTVGKYDAPLWNQYRKALEELTDGQAGGNDDGGFAEAMAAAAKGTT